MRVRIRSGRRVSDRDLGYKRAIAELLGLNGSIRVVVGIRSESGARRERRTGPPGARRAVTDSSAPSLAEIAAVHEYGAGVPARPFLGPTVDGRRSEYLAALGEVVGDAIDDRASFDVGLQRLGLRVAADAQHTIDTMVDPELADSTVATKGSSALLVDTGRLKASIDSEVRRGRGSAPGAA